MLRCLAPSRLNELVEQEIKKEKRSVSRTEGNEENEVFLKIPFSLLFLIACSAGTQMPPSLPLLPAVKIFCCGTRSRRKSN